MNVQIFNKWILRIKHLANLKAQGRDIILMFSLATYYVMTNWEVWFRLWCRDSQPVCREVVLWVPQNNFYFWYLPELQAKPIHVYQGTKIAFNYHERMPDIFLAKRGALTKIRMKTLLYRLLREITPYQRIFSTSRIWEH